MRTKPTNSALSILIFLQLVFSSSFCQIIEVDGGVGYAGVNVEEWSGISERGTLSRLPDWNNLSGYATAEVLFPISDSFYLGVSGGYQHLFWYEYEYVYDSYYGYTAWKESNGCDQ